MALVSKKKKVPTIPTSKAPVITTSIVTPSKMPETNVTAVKAPVKKKPAVPVPPKEVKTVEPPKTKPPVQREERKSPEVKEPAPASERPSTPAQPRPASSGAEKVSIEVMREMSLEARYKLWKSLNKNPEAFVAIRRELPKKMEMRKDEAILRGIIDKAVPKVKSATVYYCPYCVDYQVFHNHSWTGYYKCTGCSITSKDFYVGVDNGVFGKE